MAVDACEELLLLFPLLEEVVHQLMSCGLPRRGRVNRLAEVAHRMTKPEVLEVVLGLGSIALSLQELPTCCSDIGRSDPLLEVPYYGLSSLLPEASRCLEDL